MCVILLDPLENIRICLLLPIRQIFPVGNVSGFWIGYVFIDLAGPAQADEPALLFAGQLPCRAGGHFNEGRNLVVNRSGALAFPVWGLFPRSDIAGLGFTGV